MIQSEDVKTTEMSIFLAICLHLFGSVIVRAHQDASWEL